MSLNDFYLNFQECSVGELALKHTRQCHHRGYTCTFGDGEKCCDGRQAETRICVPCDETFYKKPQESKYTTVGNCNFELLGNRKRMFCVDQFNHNYIID